MGRGMSIRIKIHYELQHLAARIAAPVLRWSGYRFGAQWRGNPVINHVEANCMADGLSAREVKVPVRW